MNETTNGTPVEPLILWLGVGEGDGVCRRCPDGPHIHVTPAAEAERAVLGNVESARAQAVDRAERQRIAEVVQAQLGPVFEALEELRSYLRPTDEDIVPHG